MGVILLTINVLIQFIERRLKMKLRFRIFIGICFLIGALVFMAQKELLYALAFLLVGGFYIYKGVN